MSSMHEAPADLFCRHCGDRLPDHGNGLGYCGVCARRFRGVVNDPTASRSERAGERNRDRSAQTRTSRLLYGPRDPLLATLLSAIVPGGGQVYNAHFIKALLVFVTSPLVIPWILGVIDAFISARRINDAWAATRAPEPASPFTSHGAAFEARPA